MNSTNKSKALRYTVIDTSIGALGVVVSDIGIVRIEFKCPPVKKFERAIADRFGETAMHRPDDPLLKRARAQLTEYLDGKRRSFDLKLDLRVTGFRRRVLDEVARIPYGEVATYGEVARKVGNPKAARAVGGAVGANPIGLIIPCHRVVAAGGKLGGFGGGLALKKKLLKLETEV